MLILTAQDVRQALPMQEAIEAMKQAYAAFSAGEAEVPLRTRLPVAPHDALVLFMPAYVRSGHDEALAVKVVSLFPENPKNNLAYIQAAVLVLEAQSGRAQALLEGATLTAIRTGAAGGAAIDLLARPESQTLAIFGAGVQGRTQLEAACTVRPIQTVWVYDPNPQRARAFVSEMAGRGPIPHDLRIAETPSQAVQQADIICTATTSSTPVFNDVDIKPGTHISAVGSYTPQMQEIPAETVARSRVFVDSRQAVLAEAGDLIQPIRQGIFGEEHIYAELGEIVLGRKHGRLSPDEITFFKSVGLAVQDALAAQVAIKNAQKMGLGQVVNW
ncbi:MAG: ornithine cyclodeaminase family protein [Anaerolineales bacterium]